MDSERDRVRLLLRRFGFGASAKELDYYGQDGWKGAIDRLLAFDQVEAFPIDPTQFDGKGNVKPRDAQVAWFCRMLTTRRPLEEKVTLFWHNHFATSAQKVSSGFMMHEQIDTLRTHGMGRFENLLLEMAKNPAMILWLDNQENLKGKPNENFAREVMELFSLGIGHYTERDIQEAARAFTGWRFRKVKGERGRTEFYLDERNHDGDLKTVLGQTSKFNGEDICAILVSMPQSSRFIARKAWEWFGYGNPDDALVERIAQKYRAAHMETKALLRAIMEEPALYSEKSARGLVKNPVDFVVAPIRQLGFGEILRSALQSRDGEAGKRVLTLANFARISTKGMGMDILFPPDVSGWNPRAEGWISSATMLERIKFGTKLLAGGGLGQGATTIAGALSSASTAREVAALLNETLDAQLPATSLARVEEAIRVVAGTNQLTEKTLPRAASNAAKLIFGSPEYQFA